MDPLGEGFWGYAWRVCGGTAVHRRKLREDILLKGEWGIEYRAWGLVWGLGWGMYVGGRIEIDSPTLHQGLVRARKCEAVSSNSEFRASNSASASCRDSLLTFWSLEVPFSPSGNNVPYTLGRLWHISPLKIVRLLVTFSVEHRYQCAFFGGKRGGGGGGQRVVHTLVL